MKIKPNSYYKMVYKDSVWYYHTLTYINTFQHGMVLLAEEYLYNCYRITPIFNKEHFIEIDEEEFTEKLSSVMSDG